MYQSISVPLRRRIWDHGFEESVKMEQKVRKVLCFQKFLFQKRDQTCPVSSLDRYAQVKGFKRLQIFPFLLRFPHIFQIYEHPAEKALFCRLSQKAVQQVRLEHQACRDQLPDAVLRLRKLLMMSKSGRLPLTAVQFCRKAFGLPYYFKDKVILRNPNFFRLLEGKKSGQYFIETVERDPSLGVCAIERERESYCREKGVDEEDVRFSFILNFPPQIDVGKYKLSVWRWQQLPYPSPYERVPPHLCASIEGQKKLEKRMVATFHELLSLSVEKKFVLQRIAYLDRWIQMPRSPFAFFVQYQGIFYVSAAWGQGRKRNLFLREAYRNGVLTEPSDLCLARKQLDELVLLEPERTGEGMKRTPLR